MAIPRRHLDLQLEEREQGERAAPRNQEFGEEKEFYFTGSELGRAQLQSRAHELGKSQIRAEYNRCPRDRGLFPLYPYPTGGFGPIPGLGYTMIQTRPSTLKKKKKDGSDYIIAVYNQKKKKKMALAVTIKTQERKRELRKLIIITHLQVAIHQRKRK